MSRHQWENSAVPAPVGEQCCPGIKRSNVTSRHQEEQRHVPASGAPRVLQERAFTASFEKLLRTVRVPSAFFSETE